MPSHSVKQAKVMSAIAHGWHPSGLDIPVKVAKEFHAADTGHKYGKGMDKKSKALRATKHYRKYAEGGLAQFQRNDNPRYQAEIGRPALDPETLMSLLNQGKSYTRQKYFPPERQSDFSAPGFYETLPTADVGSMRVPEQVMMDRSWNDLHSDETKAGGGKVGNFDPERGAAIGLSRQGMIRSAVPGRTDKLNLNVPSGSYIIPADIPSALGQGNSTAGGAILDKMFNKGPYGMNLGRGKGGSRIGKRKSSLGFAKGGEVGQPTPIVAAGGEYTIHPETVANLGNGDMELGHSILDSFVKQIRAKHISTLKGLKPPKGSE